MRGHSEERRRERSVEVMGYVLTACRFGSFWIDWRSFSRGPHARLSFVPLSAPNHWNSFDLGRYQGVEDVVDASDQCS